MMLVGNADSSSKEGAITTGRQARASSLELPGLTGWAEASWDLEPGMSTLCLL